MGPKVRPEGNRRVGRGREPSKDRHVCKAPPVDGLPFVPNDAEIAIVERREHPHLQLVRVLELVYHHEAELPPVPLGDLRIRLEHSHGALLKIIEIEDPVAQLEFAIGC